MALGAAAFRAGFDSVATPPGPRFNPPHSRAGPTSALPTFFLALIAAAAATLGGREAVRVARLAAGLGAGAGLLAACWLACIAACALSAWLGAGITGQLGPDAKDMLVAIALLLAGIELVVQRPGRAPAGGPLDQPRRRVRQLDVEARRDRHQILQVGANGDVDVRHLVSVRSDSRSERPRAR